jgi:hypothetical protein
MGAQVARQVGAAALSAGLLAAAPIKPQVQPALIVTQLPPGTAAEKAGPRSGGMLAADWGHGARIVLVKHGRLVKVLTSDFHSAADPEVSFDGKRLLFAGQKEAGARWAIYEMDVDGSGARQVFATEDDLRQPAYLPTVFTIVADATRGTEPREHIAVVRILHDQQNEHGDAPTSAVYSVKLDGSQPRRLTFGLSNQMDPTVLRDGRLVYASWQRATLARGYAGRIALVGVHPDGMDPAVFADDEGQRIKAMPCAMTGADRLVVFVEADRVGWDGSGALAAVSLRRNRHSHRVIADASQGLFHSPAALPDGAVVAARRPADGSGTHGVVRVEPQTGRVEPVFDDPGFHDVQPRPIAPRLPPDRRSSAVKDPDEQGAATTATGPTVADAKLYGLNVYLNDLGADLPEGTIAALRVIEGLPIGATAFAPMASRRLVGEAPVERDGSFHVQIPAETPLQLQIVDRDGLALRTSGWLGVPYKGQQGCVGCHEDAERTPSNRFVDAIARPATNLLVPAAQRRTVDFRRDIQPIVSARCLSCHGEGAGLRLDGAPAAGLSPAYQALLAGLAERADGRVVGRYVHPGSARTSPLIWHLSGRNTARPWDGADAQAPFSPIPPFGSTLTDEERRLIGLWIDLGALYDAGSPPLADAAQPEAQTTGGAR